MFAIQWALVVCNLISCVTTIPSLLFPVDSEKFVGFSNKFFVRRHGASNLDQQISASCYSHVSRPTTRHRTSCPARRTCRSSG